MVIMSTTLSLILIASVCMLFAKNKFDHVWELSCRFSFILLRILISIEPWVNDWVLLNAKMREKSAILFQEEGAFLWDVVCFVLD